MSDLHTYKVMQEGDADGNYPRPDAPVARVNPWLMGVVAFCALLIVFVVFFPVFTSIGGYSPGPRSLSNVKQQVIGAIMYAADNDDRLPPAESWVDSTFPYVKNDLVYRDNLIKDRQPDQYGYAFFRPVSILDIATVYGPEKVPLTFQSIDLRRNASGDLSIRSLRPKGKGCVVSFVDGHARFEPKAWPEAPIVVVIDSTSKDRHEK